MGIEQPRVVARAGRDAGGVNFDPVSLRANPRSIGLLRQRGKDAARAVEVAAELRAAERMGKGVHAIDAIWQRIDDAAGLVRDAAVAKRLGYSGKSIIHPSQIEPVHGVFLPSKNEVEWARKVVQALGEAMERGSGRGAVRLEGKMIDAVHYKQARAILDAAG